MKLLRLLRKRILRHQMLNNKAFMGGVHVGLTARAAGQVRALSEVVIDMEHPAEIKAATPSNATY